MQAKMHCKVCNTKTYQFVEKSRDDYSRFSSGILYTCELCGNTHKGASYTKIGSDGKEQNPEDGVWWE